MKIFYESLNEQKSKYRKILSESLTLDSIYFIKENNEINFDFFLDLLKLSYLNIERNLVLLNFQLGKIKFKKNFNPKDYTPMLSVIETNPTKFCQKKKK